MPISPRSSDIVHEAGYVEKFAARQPLGNVSVNIFMKNALDAKFSRYASDTGKALRQSVTKILEWCAGLPIALSVAGSTVSLLLRGLTNLRMRAKSI